MNEEALARWGLSRQKQTNKAENVDPVKLILFVVTWPGPERSGVRILAWKDILSFPERPDGPWGVSSVHFNGYRLYRVSIKSFPDYKHILQESYVECKRSTC